MAGKSKAAKEADKERRERNIGRATPEEWGCGSEYARPGASKHRLDGHFISADEVVYIRKRAD